MSFKCFKHPQKQVEAICIEAFCNHYRFFCVTCFLEHTSHFTNHKSSILEINEVLNGHQTQIQKTHGLSEIDHNLQIIKKLMNNYENLIIQKRNESDFVIKDIERKFDESKQRCIEEVSQYLNILINKQQSHYDYLKKRVDQYKQDLSINDWKSLRKSNSEIEITTFFENLIKSPLTSHKEFKNEVKLYVQSFQRNIQELENLNNQKLVSISLDDFSNIIQEKFNELKEVLIVSNEIQNATKTKIKIQESFQFKNFKSPEYFDQNQIVIENTEFNYFNNNNNNNFNNNFQKANHQYFKKNYALQNDDENNTIELELDSDSTNQLYRQNNQNFNNNNFNNNLQQQQQQNGSIFQNQLLKQQKQQQQLKFIPELPDYNQITHSDGITSIILYDESKQGRKIIATGSLDTTIKLWQLNQSGLTHIKTLKGHTHAVNFLETFYKDGVIFLASTSQSHEINIWNPQLSGNELVTSLIGHYSGVSCLLYFDQYLISGSKDKTIKVWDMSELKCVQTISQDQPSDCLGIYESLEKQLLISACGDGLKIFNYLGKGQFKLKSYNNKAHRSGITHLKTIHDNNDVDMVTSGADGLIKLWSLDKAICVGTLRGHQSQIYKIIWKSSNQMLFSASIDGIIKVWNLKDCIKQLETNHIFKETQLSPFGSFIFVEEFQQILIVANGNNFIQILNM